MSAGGRRRGRAPGAADKALAGYLAVGPARVDRRTKRLTKRLQPGDVAVIDHIDIDRVSAEALVACRPSAVVNASPSISGRYPNLGPEIIVAAGVPLLDDVGPQVMTEVAEGVGVRLRAQELLVGEDVVGRGRLLDAESVAQAMAEARAGLSLQLEAFAANTMEYLRRERELLLDGVGVPDVRTRLDGRQVLIVVRGYHYKEDLVTLRPYVREYRPVLIGVDGGADAIIEAGWRPDMIVGDMDSVSDATLRCGAEVVVHAYRDGRAPGLERVRDLGIDPVVFPATGTSEDVAMLLADDKGASLIVALGTHATLVEFLDKGRAGMASTFLTRLRVGGKLVDAKGVSRLYRSRISNVQVLVLVLAGVLALVAALAVTPTGQAILAVTGARVEDAWAFLTGWLPGSSPQTVRAAPVAGWAGGEP
ncbi:putative cytokinetic ring protein SteA [Kineococcus glutinatus]|uniref:Cytokinetic ring protein SteA n=1 Tax=Kineococcus glutinatus TaxID=1070872 RepID=A0ABP9I896_9ACTN